MMTRTFLFGPFVVWVAVGGVNMLVGGCRPHPGQPTSGIVQQELPIEPLYPSRAIGLGDPLPGMTRAQLALFAEGKKAFMFAYDEEIGLGPVFNMISCFTCHDEPEPGGSSGFMVVTLFGRLNDQGEFDPMTEQGGPLLQRFAVSKECVEVIPPEATIRATRATTPLFGAGLIEAIPDETILALADPDDLDGDGVRGRANVVFDIAEGRKRVGRFGWKSQVATLVSFSATALYGECGITNRFFPVDLAPNGEHSRRSKCDAVADLEEPPDANGISAFDRMSDFQRLLAPPPQSSVSDERGRRLFEEIGCPACHLPTLSTGPHPIDALSYKPVHLYSDLLVHDMGSLGDGIVQGVANGSEMRTMPLWGLSARLTLLHDGRIKQGPDAIRLAIEAHDGEGAAARDRYSALSEEDKMALERFLNSI